MANQLEQREAGVVAKCNARNADSSQSQMKGRRFSLKITVNILYSVFFRLHTLNFIPSTKLRHLPLCCCPSHCTSKQLFSQALAFGSFCQSRHIVFIFLFNALSTTKNLFRTSFFPVQGPPALPRFPESQLANSTSVYGRLQFT